MMQTTFGFLLQKGTFTADVPDDVDAGFEQAASAGVNAGSPTALQCAPKTHIDFSQLGWRDPYSPTSGPDNVSIYRSDDPAALWIVWDLGTHYAWGQLQGRDALPSQDRVAAFIAGVSFEFDAQGIPRSSLSNGFVPGNPYVHNVCRDHVFYGLDGRLLTFRYDGALGVDRVTRDGEFALITVTTPLGVSVVHNGPMAVKDDLVGAAQEAAATLEQVA